MLIVYVNRIDEIRYILINFPFEVLAINESKLDGTISDTEVYIPGYIIIRKDRSRSGGCSISGKMCRTQTELTLCPPLSK